MNKTFTHDTLLLSKEAYFYMCDYHRTQKGIRLNSREFLERQWKRYAKNDYMRIDVDEWNIEPEEVKKILDKAGLKYVDDGEKISGFYMGI